MAIKWDFDEREKPLPMSCSSYRTSVAPPGLIRVFGVPCLEWAGRKWTLPVKAFAAAALLATQANAALSRARIGEILWGDVEKEKSLVNLRQLLARVRKLEHEIGTPILIADANSVSLNTEFFMVDVAEALQFDSKSLIAKGEIQQLEKFVEGLSGELFSGVAIAGSGFENWRLEVMGQLHHKAVTILRYLVASMHFEDNPAKLERLARKLIEMDRYAEVGYRVLMEIHDRHGDRPLALQTYQECRKVLRAEMGVEPEAATRRLAASLGFVEFARAIQFPSRDFRQGNQISGTNEPEAGQAATAHDRWLGNPRIVLLPPFIAVEDETVSRIATAFLEDVTSGLSRFRSFTVLAAHTSFRIGRLQAADRKFPEIKFRYAVSCTIKPSFSGLAAAFSLMEGDEGVVLWSSEWDFRLDNLSFLYSQVCHQIIYSLADAVECAEMRFPFAAKDATAYRLYLEGRSAMNGTGLPGLRAARNWYRKSIDKFDGFAPAVAGISRTLSMERLVRGLTDDVGLKEALGFADRASAIDPFDGRGMRERGFTSLYLRRHDESLVSFERAAELNPSDADLLADYADALAHSGFPAEGLEKCRRAIALNAICPHYYYWILGSIYYQTGEYQAAIAALEPVKDSPETARLLAACFAMVGDLGTAGHYVVIMRETYPDFRLEQLPHIVPDKFPKDTKHLMDGLRIAGLE